MLKEMHPVLCLGVDRNVAPMKLSLGQPNWWPEWRCMAANAIPARAALTEFKGKAQSISSTSRMLGIAFRR